MYLCKKYLVMIITAPDLFLIDGELLTSDGFGGFMKIHNYQGSLDGACSVYSLTMSLLYENIVAYEETETPSRKNGGRLLKELFSNYGLIKSGFHFSILKKIIEKYKTAHWRVEYKDGSPSECVKGICREIGNGCAPIIGIGYCGLEYGHALLVVGYEENDGKVEKIYCLDPGAPTPKTSVWNSYIDVRDLRKRSKYVNTMTTDHALVKIEDYIIIENKKDIPISRQ